MLRIMAILKNWSEVKNLNCKIFLWQKINWSDLNKHNQSGNFFDFFIGILLDRVKCQLQFANSSDGAIIIVQERGKYGLVLQIFTDIGLLCCDQMPGILQNTSRTTWLLLSCIQLCNFYDG